jgi:hypothetical protein
VRRLSRGTAQVLLPDGQRAQLAGPGLHDDEADQRQMGKAQRPVTDPCPAAPRADDKQRLRADDEQHDADVDGEDQVGEQGGGRHGRGRRGLRPVCRGCANAR